MLLLVLNSTSSTWWFVETPSRFLSLILDTGFLDLFFLSMGGPVVVSDAFTSSAILPEFSFRSFAGAIPFTE